MKNLGLRKYALAILKTHECGRDTFRTSNDPDKSLDEQIAATVADLMECKDDLLISKEIFQHPKYTAEEIVRELYAIGDAVPPPKKDKYHLIWDTDDCTDGFDVGNNIKSLKEKMEDLLIEWMVQFSDQEDKSTDAWDYMIFNCGCRCYRNADLTPDVDLDRIWCYALDDDDFKRIGWVTTDEMDNEIYATCAEMYGWPKR